MDILSTQIDMFIASGMDIQSSGLIGIDEFDLIIELYKAKMKELKKNRENRING